MGNNSYGSYSNSSGGGMGTTIFMLLYFAAIILILVAIWKIFVKAKRPGWAIIIPIYNLYVLLKIVGRPGWWVILYFIPLVNLIIHLIVSLDLAKAFGRSGIFGFFFVWLFAPIGYLILGFGGSKYQAPTAK